MSEYEGGGHGWLSSHKLSQRRGKFAVFLNASAPACRLGCGDRDQSSGHLFNRRDNQALVAKASKCRRAVLRMRKRTVSSHDDALERQRWQETAEERATGKRGLGRRPWVFWECSRNHVWRPVVRPRQNSVEVQGLSPRRRFHVKDGSRLPLRTDDESMP
ncbi:hypothetical protein BC567DRAFT_101342 [Phyllosticta citribraziliensis]